MSVFTIDWRVDDHYDDIPRYTFVISVLHSSTHEWNNRIMLHKSASKTILNARYNIENYAAITA